MADPTLAIIKSEMCKADPTLNRKNERNERKRKNTKE